MRIFKYMSPGILNLIFSREGFAGLRCSTPAQYNDPYELFLGVDTRVSVDLLARYQEFIQSLPQLPTTCFSRSPVVTPMWAHYASNHAGFVLEFDVDRLKQVFPGASIRDISYKDAPDGSIEGALQMASQTKKPRHVVWLRQTVLMEAYFSKQTSWSYEQECRLIDYDEYTEDKSGVKILYVPVDCIRSIIVGKNASDEDIDYSKTISSSFGVRWLAAKVGKVQTRPFFVAEDGRVFEYQDGDISRSNCICSSCAEPIAAGKTTCAWCAITDVHRLDAARNNPLRMLDHFGLLEEYFAGVEKIEKGK